MAPAGCGRVCASCATTVHDLSGYSIDDVEALLRRDPAPCVRACVGADGAVALKPGRGGSARRMVASIGVSIGLLAAGGPALAGDRRPQGIIEGRIANAMFRTMVTVTGPDGRHRRARVRGNGRYRISHLAAGTYTLTFVPDCGDSWTISGVDVLDGQRTGVPASRGEGGCIVVGLLRIDTNQG